MNITWKIQFTKASTKQITKLNKAILLVLRFLVEELTVRGPTIHDWPNYGKLHGKSGQDKYHCHLKKGKPTYVCCWEVVNKKEKIIEVYYVGTHEKAPY